MGDIYIGIDESVCLTKTAETPEANGRYRKVFSSHWECADTWSRLCQPAGESGPLNFHGGTMFSYSTAIARLVSPLKGEWKTMAFFDPDRHSMTTVSKHRPPTLRAANLRGHRIFWVYNVDADTQEEHLANRRHMEKETLMTLLRAKKAQKKNRKDYVSNVLSCIDEARRYAQAVGLDDSEEDVRTIWGSQAAGMMLNKLYADLDYSICPIMADAIEEAGCTDEELLATLRKL